MQKPRLNEADLSVLGPLAEHRVLIAPQLALILGVSPQKVAGRMYRLRRLGLVSYGVVYYKRPAVASLTRRGRAVMGLPGSAPARESIREHRHDVGVAWLWLAASRGAFGRLESIQTETAMIAADQSAKAAGGPRPGHVPIGLGLGQIGPYGQPRRHYPDLLLTTHTGHKVALELEMHSKSKDRMDRIMTAYASDARVDLVVYLVPTPGVARTVSEAARRAGISDMVQVRPLAPDAVEGVDGLGSVRERGSAARAREPRAPMEAGR